MNTRYARRYTSVLLCIILVLTSLSSVCAAEYHPSAGVCYILPVYSNVYRFAELNKTSLHSDNNVDDVLWIKENANVQVQDHMSFIDMPSCTVWCDIGCYTTVDGANAPNCHSYKGKMYHMLN